jgi:hypothetical protein
LTIPWIEADIEPSVVKLVKNWRSHPDILKFPNDQFYGGELKSCGDPAITQSLLNSDVLARPRFPVIFHAVHGRDQREESSPSFFNIDEATIVKNYCMSLLGDRSSRLSQYTKPIRLRDDGKAYSTHLQRRAISVSYLLTAHNVARSFNCSLATILYRVSRYLALKSSKDKYVQLEDYTPPRRY